MSLFIVTIKQKHRITDYKTVTFILKIIWYTVHNWRDSIFQPKGEKPMNKNNILWNKWIRVLCTFVLMCSLSSCASSNTSVEDNQKEQVLRIGISSIHSNAGLNDYYRKLYAETFELSFPNVKVELVSPSLDEEEYYRKMDTGQTSMFEEMKKVITGDRPVDVIIGGPEFLNKLVQHNMVKPLEPLMKQANMNIDDFVPSIISTIKEIGQGTLYGLAPTFITTALFYNEDRFKEVGVELPKDGMTWPEVFALAERLTKTTGKDQLYGFSFGVYDPFSFSTMLDYTCPLQLKWTNDEIDKMTVNTPQWEQVWNTFQKLSNNKVIQQRDDQDEIGRGYAGSENMDAFKKGKTAMTLAYNGYASELIEYNKKASSNKQYKPVRFNIVTHPVHPEKRDEGGSGYFEKIMCINNKSSNASLAWEYINFMNGEKMAKVKSRSVGHEMSTFKKYIRPIEGQDYNVAAFCKLKPVIQDTSMLYKPLLAKPNLDLHPVLSSAEPFFKKTMEGKMTVKEALEAWEKKGNEMLAKLKQDPKTKFER